jgi:hypothetical protein
VLVGDLEHAHRGAACAKTPGSRAWTTALRVPKIKALVRDGHSSCPCSTIWTSPKSSPRTTQGSGRSAARTHSWKPSDPQARESPQGTEVDLAKIAAAGQRERRPLRGTDKIALRADAVQRSGKVAEQVTIEITDANFSYAATPTPHCRSRPRRYLRAVRHRQPGSMNCGQVVSSYKALVQVERAFRALDTELDIRAIRHRTEEQVRAHVLSQSCRSTSPGT